MPAGTIGPAAGGGGADVPVPKAGGGFVNEVAIDGRTIQKVHYRYVELEPEPAPPQADGSSESLLLIPTAVEDLRPEGTRAVRPVATVAEAELHAFLADIWDPHVDGKEDPGVNGRAFREFLTDLELEPTLFLAIWKKAGLSMAELATQLRSLREAAMQIGAQSADGGMLRGDDWAQRVAAEASARMGTRPDDAGNVVLKLLQGEDFPELGAWLHSLVRKAGAQPALTTQGLTGRLPGFHVQGSGRSGKPVDPDHLVGELFDVGPPAWRVVKANDPWPGVTIADQRTFLLHARDRDPRSYSGGRAFRSKTYRFRITNPFIPAIVYADVEFALAGTHDARHPSLPGRYLPDIHYDFTISDVNFPTRVNVWSNIEEIRNQVDEGYRSTNPNPMLVLNTDLEFLYPFSAGTSTTFFTVTLRGEQGVTGYTYEGGHDVY